MACSNLAMAILTTLAVAGDPQPPYWPRFHGPDGDNISRDTGLKRRWPDEGPKLLWTVEGIGEGYSSVSIADGLIYTAGNLRDKTAITAMSLDGSVRWRAPAGKPWVKAYAGSRATPTFDNGRLYHQSPLGQIVCLDAKTGRQIWTLNVLEEFEARNITWGLAESLLVDGERLVCCPGGANASMVALDKQTGEPVWIAKSTGDLAGYATATVAEYRGMRIILTMNAKALIGVNAHNGELLFRHLHETRLDSNAVTPIFHDGQIFITAGHRSGAEMLRLAVDGQNVAVERIWRSSDLDNFHGGVILLDGYLYGAAHLAKNARRTPWVCLDWKTGRTMHTAKGVGMGSLTCADGLLFVLSEKGQAGLVEADPAKHRLVGRFELPTRGEGPVWAHPVVCGGRLYIRHGDVLFTYDVRAR
jgi:outer membrane protein assembly factor BamB